MDQKKVGGFLKELRKEKGLTQEQLAEQFGVSDRTVSRWENGNNMPDLDILIEISDFYDVDLREIFNGERKSEMMNKETKETVLQAVDYTNTQAEKCNRRIRICNATGMLIFVAFMFLKDTDLYMTNHTVSVITDIAQGMAVGLVFAAFIMSTRYGAKVRAFKKRLLGKNII
ncbi:MAG: helix-turn-helix transcriptional regulator [Lachnospiraceae bacterium]|nr:helix-turn-helix transcriptional regulator [Lachnospiraceae bacterium]